MDLIYTDENRVDIGVLHEYSMDIAYGVSENNFELEVMITNPAVLKQDSFVYFDNTEYGGIIDAIEVDTENKNIVYSAQKTILRICNFQFSLFIFSQAIDTITLNIRKHQR